VPLKAADPPYHTQVEAFHHELYDEQKVGRISDQRSCEVDETALPYSVSSCSEDYVTPGLPNAPLQSSGESFVSNSSRMAEQGSGAFYGFLPEQAFILS
jgi:hypothetical protein